MKGAYIDSLKALRSSTFVNNVLKLAAGSAIGQALVMLSTPLIARLCSDAPANGKFAVVIESGQFYQQLGWLRHGLQ